MAIKPHSLRQLPYWQHQPRPCSLTTLATGVSNSIYHCRQAACVRQLSTPSASRAKRQALDRDVIVSVLEASATRRDAKSYLQKYASKQPKLSESSREIVENDQVASEKDDIEPVNVAIVKLRFPQDLPSGALHGIARTLSQLRVLGLLALVVVDCGIAAGRQVFDDEALRLCEAVDSFGSPGAKLADHIFLGRASRGSLATEPRMHADLRIEDQGLLSRALQQGMIVVIPSLARQDEISSRTAADANETTLALTKFLTGLQLDYTHDIAEDGLTTQPPPRKIASVERMILLDPAGGPPMARRPHVSHRFINLEQEYEDLIGSLKTNECTPESFETQSHAANLRLAKTALSFLPPTSSALITTPFAAANTRPSTPATGMLARSTGSPLFGLDDMVTTRKQKNPLLHNLLTDRPAYSPSLPLQRIQDEKSGGLQNTDSGSATLIKRGMPVTVYPDPRVRPWLPPKPDSPRLRLTDNCIDIPRLVYLIEDSFNRKLDAQHYLERVRENLAGIIIAGEYEGCAILTWERPDGIDDQTAYESDRYVPYLDKFAVLKSRQGSSGVADVVFNSMVQDCFPGGVCWRSRKDNPVNKWYFERSTGTCKLSNSNWTMFWTSMGLENRHTILRDYESVCRGIKPSWADKKHIPE